MGRYRVIMTVGTSLVDNKGGNRTGDSQKQLACVVEAADQFVQWPTCERARARLLQTLLRLDPAAEVAHRSEEAEPQRSAQGPEDRLPQELSYLYLLLNGDEEEGNTYDADLLASDSDLGLACAQLIHAYLDQQKSSAGSCWAVINEVKVHPVRGLQGHNEDKFRTQGAPKLVEIIRDLANNGEYDRVFVNPTGGFKALVPYAIIALAFVDREREFEVHYLFHNSKWLIRLPAYPLGLDFPLWHRQANLLRAADKSRAYLRVLDSRIQSLAGRSSNAVEKLTKVFHEAYSKQAASDPFQDYSSAVVNRLLEGCEAQDYRDRLLGLIDSLGPLIWLGDKVPMAAEHAARHHHDLLETTELLLLPMLEADGSFLTVEERFVLLAAVLLHDCGHTLDALATANGTVVPLFPSEVRDLHHFLSYYRLTETRHAERLRWDPSASLAEEVAWLCLYHRRRTGWEQAETSPGKGFCPYLKLQAPPPLEAKRPSGEPFEVDLPKLVVLLRLIDGCDNQSRRAGPPPTVDALKGLFEQDRETQWARFKGLAEACCQYLDRQEEDRPGSELARQGASWTPDQDTLRPSLKRHWETRRCLATSADADPVWARLWIEMARALDEVEVRDRQWLHFAKHQAVHWVYVYPDEDWSDGDRWSFVVELMPDKDRGDLLDKELRELAPEAVENSQHGKTLRKWIGEEVSSELGAPNDNRMVQYLSNQAKRTVRFRFVWSNCRHTPIAKFDATPTDTR